MVTCRNSRAPRVIPANSHISTLRRLLRMAPAQLARSESAISRTVVSNGAPTSRSRRSPTRLVVGIDVASIAEVASALDAYGERYVQRIFTDDEAAYCRAARGRARAARFAARFAAKEAAIKALAPARRPVDWRAIEVRRANSGRCALRLHGAAATLAARRGVSGLAVSLTHDGDLAAAIVIGERGRSRAAGAR